MWQFSGVSTEGMLTHSTLPSISWRELQSEYNTRNALKQREAVGPQSAPAGSCTHHYYGLMPYDRDMAAGCAEISI
jgi:hypothetical protein